MHEPAKVQSRPVFTESKILLAKSHRKSFWSAKNNIITDSALLVENVAGNTQHSKLNFWTCIIFYEHVLAFSKFGKYTCYFNSTFD